MARLPVDGILDTVLAKSRNMLVPYYLMASYLYYHRDVSLLSDARYDLLCKELDAEWETVAHRHKGVIDRSQLKAGTGFALPADLYPSLAVHGACHLAGIKPPKMAPPPRARVRTRLQPVAA